LDPRAVDDLVVIGVENGKGIDVITFALRLRANRLSFLNGSKSERKIRCGRWGVRQKLLTGKFHSSPSAA
jgi:hypothetical protein